MANFVLKRRYQKDVTTQANMSDSNVVKPDPDCPDLPMKECWLIVFFEGSDPGNEFEIFNKSQLDENSWDTLTKGESVIVKQGSAKLQGIVVAVSEEKRRLETDMEYLKENFLEDLYGEADMTKIMEVFLIRQQRKRRRHLSSSSYVHKETVKVANKETQTDKYYDMRYENLKRKFKVLAQYENSLQFIKLLSDVFDELKADTSETQAEKNGLGALPGPLGLEKPLNRLFNTPAKVPQVAKKSRAVNGTNGLPLMLLNAENMENESISEENSEPKLAKVADESISEQDDEQMVPIGSGKTKVQKSVMESINGKQHTTATRKLLMAVFSRDTLATHSLTGKLSPAFKSSDKRAKTRLDPDKVADIIATVKDNCPDVTQTMIRSAITTKCADENKMYRKRMQKKGKENSDPKDGGEKKPIRS